MITNTNLDFILNYSSGQYCKDSGTTSYWSNSNLNLSIIASLLVRLVLFDEDSPITISNFMLLRSFVGWTRLTCSTTLLLSVALNWQKSHWKRCLKWIVFKWRWSPSFRLNFTSQWSQDKLFSPWTNLICLARSFGKCFPQWGQYFDFNSSYGDDRVVK